ncbi:response regulator [uncultured Deefgea sp.]|uniref:response regulator n=1 Tax=uncultured Deefgea sp. TaxID=1304914 RepID=UPI00261DFEDA|nr:response regulator [uncultured Deefgea sp.]
MMIDDENWLEEDTDLSLRAEIEPWNVLVVDDEPDIHHVTKLALSNIDFLNRPLNLLSCYSGAEALDMLNTRDDIALVLLDVVMESEDAGLNVARDIREKLHNHHIRIILRTGQPGVAPERHVIENYDINDYKAKTELTRDKLYTAVLGTLRSYNDIMLIEHQRRQLDANRRGLIKVVDASTTIFKQQSVIKFAQGVLEQLQSLLFFEQDALYVVVSGGMAALSQSDDLTIMYATGGYQAFCGQNLDNAELSRLKPSIDEALAQRHSIFAADHFIGFFQAPLGSVNLLIIDGPVALSHPDANLIDMFCKNVAIAYENLMLNKEIEETQRSIIYQLSEVIENRSKDTGKHIHRMAEFSYAMAIELGMSEEDAEIIRIASPLHDIGKVGIPDSVLNKPGALDAEERAVMNTHAQLGYEMLKASKPRILKMAAVIAHQHHEKWNGTGYPQQLVGEQIHIAGRIIALADVYDALAHSRCYKPPWSRERVLEEIQAGSGTHFDPEVVEAFFRCLPKIEEIRMSYRDYAD